MQRYKEIIKDHIIILLKACRMIVSKCGKYLTQDFFLQNSLPYLWDSTSGETQSVQHQGK